MHNTTIKLMKALLVQVEKTTDNKNLYSGDEEIALSDIWEYIKTLEKEKPMSKTIELTNAVENLINELKVQMHLMSEEARGQCIKAIREARAVVPEKIIREITISTEPMTQDESDVMVAYIEDVMYLYDEHVKSGGVDSLGVNRDIQTGHSITTNSFDTNGKEL